MASITDLNNELLRDDYLFSKHCVTYVDNEYNIIFTSLYNPFQDALPYKIIDPNKYYQVSPEEKDKLYYLDIIALNSYFNYNYTIWLHYANMIIDTLDIPEYDYFILIDIEKISNLIYESSRIIVNKLSNLLDYLELQNISIMNYLLLFRVNNTGGLTDAVLNYQFPSGLTDNDYINFAHDYF